MLGERHPADIEWILIPYLDAAHLVPLVLLERTLGKTALATLADQPAGIFNVMGRGFFPGMDANPA